MPDYPFFFTWSAQRGARPLHLTGGAGAWFTTADGGRHLDLGSLIYQMNAGHGHRRIIEAVKAQADRLCVSVPAAVYPEKVELARRLLERAPPGFTKVFFTLGGSDATENALKMARLSTGRFKAISRYRSYHGATMGAVSLSGDWRRRAVEPGLPGIVHVLDTPFGERSRIPETMELEGEVGAVFVESVVGANGVLVPSASYLSHLREACDAHGALLVFDEVLTGFGRTGEWFAFQHWDVAPDLITCGKAITAGYGTLGAVLVHERVARSFDERVLAAGLTHYAHPLAVAAALEAQRVYAEEGLVQRARDLEPRLREGLSDMRDLPSVGDSRVIGLLSATEVALDAGGWERLREGLERRRVYTHLVPARGQIILSPPLCISEDELATGLSRVREAIEEASHE